MDATTSAYEARNVSVPVTADNLYDRDLIEARDVALQELAWLKAHASGRLPDSVNFTRFMPSVTVGHQQAIEREARLDFCNQNNIIVSRRLTGGGALYLDQGQQCFSLLVNKSRLGQNLSERLETGTRILASSLKKIGIQAEFKSPNDLQIEGRQKIASVFIAEHDQSALLFGTIIVDLDLKSAMQAILVPTEKLTVTGLEHAKERMTSLSEILGARPDTDCIQLSIRDAITEKLQINPATLGLPSTEDNEASPVHFNAENWIPEKDEFETKDKVEGATLRSLLSVTDDNRIKTIRFSTDAHISPAALFPDLQRHLQNVQIAECVEQSKAFLAAYDYDASGFCSDDLLRLIERSISKYDIKRDLDLSIAQASGLMLAGHGHNPTATLEKANVMLVPYCSKPNWCKWRHTIDCVECGECEVGDAYTLARERNMEVITITNFEHLADTLKKMKSAGVESYVGMCCGEFFLKRHHAFRDSGMDAILLDIEGATCYELKEEHLAYAGAFQAEAKLDLDAVKKLMAHVPAKSAASRPCISGVQSRPGEKSRGRSDRSPCGNCGCSSNSVKKN